MAVRVAFLVIEFSFRLLWKFNLIFLFAYSQGICWDGAQNFHLHKGGSTEDGT